MVYNPIEYFTGPAHNARPTSWYGMRDDPLAPGTQRFHYGVDLVLTPRGGVYTTPYDCVITFIGTLGARGLTIVGHIIGTNVNQLFQHMASARCKVGDQLRVGDPVGVEGATGAVTGRHLHYELRIRDGSNIGSPVWGDPLEFYWGGSSMRRSHKVVSGNTLSKIASQYGVTTAQIVEWNRDRYPDIGTGSNALIRLGWVLYVEPDWKKEAQQLQGDVDKLKADLAKAQAEAAKVPNLQAEVKHYEGRVTDLLEQISEIQAKDADRVHHIKQQDQVIESLTRQLRGLEEQAEAQADAIDDMANKIHEFTVELEHLAKESIEAKGKLIAVNEEKAKLQEELARYHNLLVLEFSWSHVVGFTKALLGKYLRRM